MKIQHLHQGMPIDRPMTNGGGGSPDAPAVTSSTSVKEIPTWAQPSAQDLLARGSELSKKPYEVYGGQRIAGLNDQQLTGFNAIQNRALNGSAEETNARGNFNDVMSGKFLSPDSNPYLKSMANTAMNDVQTRVNSQFGGNNYGTTAHQETLARALGDAATNMYGQNYVNERNNQAKYAIMTPQFGNIDYNNAQQLVGIGDIYRQENQDQLNTQYGDWVAQQNQPYRQLDVLANALGASVGGQGSVQAAGYSSNPYTANRYANAVGGALAGSQLGSSLFGDSANASAYGAGVGGLLGYLGS